MVIYLVVDDARNIYLMHWMTMCTEGDKRNVCTTVAGRWINVLNQRLPNAFIWQSAITTSMKHQTFCSQHISLSRIFIQGIKSERTFFQKSILRCKKFWPQSIIPQRIRIDPSHHVTSSLPLKIVFLCPKSDFSSVQHFGVWASLFGLKMFPSRTRVSASRPSQLVGCDWEVTCVDEAQTERFHTGKEAKRAEHRTDEWMGRFYHTQHCLLIQP